MEELTLSGDKQISIVSVEAFFLSLSLATTAAL
jgi:hypothetical protein